MSGCGGDDHWLCLTAEKFDVAMNEREQVVYQTLKSTSFSHQMAHHRPPSFALLARQIVRALDE